MAFGRWADRTGFESYDPYDVWGTRYGVFSRRLYYRVPFLGVPLIAPVVFIEMVCPQLRKLFLSKQRFATADAQLLLGFLNLYQVTEEPDYLNRAEALADDLLSRSIPGFGGYCWGYPFDWQNSSGLWRKNTPFITAVPYCYEAFVTLAETTGQARYVDVAKSIARFVHDDLNDTETSSDAAAASYSPVVHDKVVNASAYRAFVLFDAAHRFDVSEYFSKAERNLNFILETQGDDGSWPYAVDDGHESFIDHFHTCFVLKNLFKINQYLQKEEVGLALVNGYRYYRNALFYRDGMPRYYARSPRTQIVRVETYNFAEAITLGVLLRDKIPSAYQVAQDLALRLSRDFQLSDGHFVTRVYASGVRHTLPFMRWPQAQLFYALTSLLVAKNGHDRQGSTPEHAFDDRKRKVPREVALE